MGEPGRRERRGMLPRGPRHRCCILTAHVDCVQVACAPRRSRRPPGEHGPAGQPRPERVAGARDLTTVVSSRRVIIEKYYQRLTLDFDTNKRICEEVAIIQSKRLRNKIAGFTTVSRRQRTGHWAAAHARRRRVAATCAPSAASANAALTRSR